ncbi:MAG: hypothetical protein HG427_006360 [Flavobacteriaceae bacterium]|nr:hypothetical protein [Flavobacteriaceae bacterium]
MENLNNENQENQEQKNDEIKISKRSLYIAFSIIGALILGVSGYFVFFGKNKDAEKVVPQNDSALVNKDSANVAKKDSLSGDYEGEYDPYTLYKVISNTLTLPNGQKLNFGDEVYLDEEKSSSGNSIIYLNNPHKVPSTKQYPISVDDEVLIDSYSFTEFKNSFSLPPFSSLPPGVKKVILEADGYHDGRTYNVTQNADRAKSTLSTGDFDGDGVKDYAVILDDNEGQVSRLVIISINKVTKKPYVSFAENYNDKLKLKSFSKGASIYMNSSSFIKAPRDGVLISNEVGGLVVIYDTNAQKYKTYEQQPIATADSDYVEE